MGLKLGVDFRLWLSTTESVPEEEVVERAAVDEGVLIDAEEDGKDIVLALRGVDPIENKFIALTPEQEAPLSAVS